MPAFHRRVTLCASRIGTRDAKAFEPNVVVTPAVSTRSLTAVGTPNRAEVSRCAAGVASTCAAAASAASFVRVMNAPNRLSWASARPM